MAYKIGLTDFEHISIDGTIKSADNSLFNIIKEKDISLLIMHFMVEELSKDEIKKLRRTDRKFLEDKSNVFFFLLVGVIGLFVSGVLALNNHDARLMKTKDKGQKYPKFSFNIIGY